MLPLRPVSSAAGLLVSLTLCAGALTLTLLPRCSDERYHTADGGPSSDLPWRYDGQLPVADSYLNPCAPEPPPTVSGRVLAPNGVDPVAGASVHVLLAVAPLPDEVRCEACESRGKFGAVTHSAPDGSFTLVGVPNSPFTLGIQKGHFRRVLNLHQPECVRLELPAEQTTLPGQAGQWHELDAVPAIAVVTGAYDDMGRVLDKLGVLEKDFFNGRDFGTGPDSVQALLQNLARMRRYQMILINCGTRFEALVTSPTDPIARNNLRDYVLAGGRLFVTDFSYDYVEQAFPEMIDFEGSDGTPLAEAEEANAAEIGAELPPIQATILDNDLAAWLALPEIDALLPNGNVEITGFLAGWAVQRTVNSALGAKVWVEAPVRWVGGSGVRPLTTSFDYRGKEGTGCGRVLFSSYHTHGEQEDLLPQERILEYLLLEIGVCPVVE